jgi:hypothetical protein
MGSLRIGLWVFILALSSSGLFAQEGVSPKNEILAAVRAVPSYCIVVSKATGTDKAWSQVMSALGKKYPAAITIPYENDVRTVLTELKQVRPRYTCFVATPKEANRDFVAAVHQLTRAFDDDPYTDTFWGILTGYDAANALQIAQLKEPLTITKAAAGTEIVLAGCREATWYCELNAGKIVRKVPGEGVKTEQGTADSTANIVNTLNESAPDLFVTSGHATERDWMIGFSYRNGFFKSSSGQMFGEDTKKQRLELNSPNPKVYLAVGNCLMGNIDGPDAMALAWMNDCGVKQMVGYTVPTWYGYGGWGLLDYFVEQPGRYTLTESFFANQAALIHALETGSGDRRGLQYDRDTVAFYGDPAWEARMSAGDCWYEQSLVERNGEYVFTVTPKHGAESFHPVNKNGSQRGWRPIVQFLPQRLSDIKIISGEQWKPVVTDDFLLLPNPRECPANEKIEIVFRGGGK